MPGKYSPRHEKADAVTVTAVDSCRGLYLPGMQNGRHAERRASPTQLASNLCECFVAELLLLEYGAKHLPRVDATIVSVLP